MFKNPFQKIHRGLADDAGPDGFPSLEGAAELLSARSAPVPLNLTEARIVVKYMFPRHIAQGTVFIREGDDQGSGFMLLVVAGEVTVESLVVSRVSPITVAVLGVGSMHGDLGLMDGLPRSATCTASADLNCAILTREGLMQLVADHPGVGVKLVMAIASQMATRLRDNTSKLKKYVQLTKAMQQEIDHLDRLRAPAKSATAPCSNTPDASG